MKTTIENYQLLMIRACKRNRYSTRTLRRIYAKSRALSLEHTPIEYATSGLMEINNDFELVKDWHQFIVEVNNKRIGYFSFSAPIAFNEAFLFQCADVIASTRLKHFPRYPSPAFFRNQYKEDYQCGLN